MIIFSTPIGYARTARAHFHNNDFPERNSLPPIHLKHEKLVVLDHSPHVPGGPLHSLLKKGPISPWAGDLPSPKRFTLLPPETILEFGLQRHLSELTDYTIAQRKRRCLLYTFRVRYGILFSYYDSEEAFPGTGILRLLPGATFSSW